MATMYLDELFAIHVPSRPCPADSARKELAPRDYANAKAAGFDMSQFSVAKPRYLRC